MSQKQKFIASLLTLCIFSSCIPVSALHLIDEIINTKIVASQSISNREFTGEYMKENYSEIIDEKEIITLTNIFGYKLKENYKYLANWPLVHEYNEKNEYIKTILINKENDIFYYKEINMPQMEEEEILYKETIIGGMPDIHYSVVSNDKVYINQNTLSKNLTCVPASMAMKLHMEGINIDVEDYIKALEIKNDIDFRREGISVQEGISLLQEVDVTHNTIYIQNSNRDGIIGNLLENKRPLIIYLKNNIAPSRTQRVERITEHSNGTHCILITGFVIKDNKIWYEVYDPDSPGGGNAGAGVFMAEDTLKRQSKGLGINIFDFDIDKSFVFTQEKVVFNQENNESTPLAS